MKERDIEQMYFEQFVLREAIYEVKGVDVATARGRKLEVVISKMIFCYECEKLGYKRKELAEYLNTSVGSIGYSIRKYADEIKYDRRFARLVRLVDEARQRITEKLNFNHKKIN